MNKKLFKPLAFIFSILLVFASLTGIQLHDVQAKTLENAVTVSAVDDEGEEVLSLTAVSFEPGATAYDVLKDAAGKRDIELEAADFGSMGYMVKKIGDIEENIPFYWSFNIQGKYSNEGVSSYQVKNGDNLTFKFVSMEDGMNAPVITTSVSAVDSDGNAVIEKTDVEITRGSTAYDALYQAAATLGVHLDVSVDNSLFTFISNIGDIELGEFDYWNLSVNDTSAEVGVLQYQLNDGDTVQFEAQSFDPPTEDNENNDSDKEDDVNNNDSDENGNDNQEGNGENSNNNGNYNDEGNADNEDDKNNYDVTEHLDDLFGYVDEKVKFEYGSEWWIWGLAHTDYPIPNSYIESIKKEVKNADGEFGGLELQKIIISLSLLGEDATNFAGYNLIDILVKNSPYPGVNGDIYTLLALDSDHYDVAEEIRSELIRDILGAETPNNGWAFFGDSPTVDITAMALTALATYQDNPDVKAATDRAIDYLSEAQEKNGGFYEKFNGGDSSESVSQVIVALTAMGMDPTGDVFTKDEGNLLDHLIEFKQQDGGYAHILGDDYSMEMSTQQALLALVAYEKFVNGTGSVYQQPVIDNSKDDSDKEENNKENDGNKSDTDNGNENEKNENQPTNDKNKQSTVDQNSNEQKYIVEADSSESSDSKDGSILPNTASSMFNFLLIGLLLIVAGGAAIFINKRRKSAKM